MFVGAVDLAIQFPHGAVVERGARQQTIKLYGLDGQQDDDAPHPLRRQITDGDKQQAVARIQHQDVAIVEGYVDDTKHKQQAHTPGKAAREVLALLLLVVVHDEETQSEEHGEDAVHLA